MTEIEKLDRIAIDVRSHKLLRVLLSENPELENILRSSKNETEVVVGVREWVERNLKDRENAFKYYHARHSNRELFNKLEWRDFAIIRILDYIDLSWSGVTLPLSGFWITSIMQGKNIPT
jgi:lysine 2,3-aminomutase